MSTLIMQIVPIRLRGVRARVQDGERIQNEVSSAASWLRPPSCGWLQLIN